MFKKKPKILGNWTEKGDAASIAGTSFMLLKIVRSQLFSIKYKFKDYVNHFNDICILRSPFVLRDKIFQPFPYKRVVILTISLPCPRTNILQMSFFFAETLGFLRIGI